MLSSKKALSVVKSVDSKVLSKIRSSSRGTISSIQVLPNGQIASAEGMSCTISIWDIESGACVRTLSTRGSAFCMAALPNGMLVSGACDHSIEVWNSTTGECVGKLTGHRDRINDLVVLPNGQLASGSDDKSIKIWDVEQLSCVGTFFRAHSDKVSCLAVLPNGQLASGSYSGSVKVWNVLPGRMWGVRGECVHIFRGHRGGVTSLVASPNGQLASGSFDDSIKVWDLSRRTCLATFPHLGSYVKALSVLPDGRLLSYVGEDSVIKMWDVARNACVGTLQNPLKGAYSMLVLPSGQLVSGAGDLSIKIWPLDLQSVLQPVSELKVTSARTAPSTQGSDPLKDNIKHLSHSNLQFRKDAIAAFVSLSIKPENRLPIAEAGAIPPIVRLLADPDRLVAGNAIKALWNLSIDEANKATIAEAGAIQPLVQFLVSADRSMKESALRALRNLSFHGPSTLCIAQAGAIPPLVQCLVDADPVMRQNAVSLLQNLSSNIANMLAITQAGAIPPLVRLLQDDNFSVRKHTVEAIQNLTCNEINQIAFAQAGAIPYLVRLFDDENEDIRKGAGFSLGNIGENPANCAAMVNADAPIVLKRFLALSEFKDRTKYIQDVLVALQSFVDNQSQSVVREIKPSYSPSLPSPGGLVEIPSHELQIQAKLGEGGFGVVSKALWQGTTLVALKQLSSPYLPDAMLAEFRQEAEIHSSLRHPNIVILYGACLEHMKYALVMELMVKGSLYGVINSAEALPWSRRIGIALDAMAGLCFLHERSIVHRDLKSMNILLDANGVAKLADFGLAKVKNASSTTTAGAVGTLYWMAPELFRMNGQCSKATDIYAMGMVLWEIAARKLPYQSSGGNQALVMQWVKEGEREDIPDATPPGIARLITQCWAARPEQRPVSARVVIDALKAAQGSPVAAAAETGYQQFSLR